MKRGAVLRPIELSEINFTPADPELIPTGILAFVSCTLNKDLRLDGLAIRRTRDGRILLSFPARLDRAGRKHPVVFPRDDGVRREIERQVLRALRSRAAELAKTTGGRRG